MTCSCEGLIPELNVELSRLTHEVAEIRGLVLNDVLLSGTFKIPAGAPAAWTWQTQAPFAQLLVVRQTANVLTIDPNPLRDAAPLTGPGLLVIAGAATVGGPLRWPATGNVITVYGTAGDTFCLAALSRAYEG